MNDTEIDELCKEMDELYKEMAGINELMKTTDENSAYGDYLESRIASLLEKQAELIDSPEILFYNLDIAEGNEEKTKHYLGILTKMAEDDAEAQWYLSKYYDSLRDDENMWYWLSKAAENGHAKAQCAAAICYYYGYFCQPDENKSVKLLSKAAKQGEAKAQCDLATCYVYGVVVKRDYSKAAKLYEEAAAQNFAEAQYKLGLCYYCGEGVAKNYSQAKYWCNKAAGQGHKYAEEVRLGHIKLPGEKAELDCCNCAVSDLHKAIICNIRYREMEKFLESEDLEEVLDAKEQKLRLQKAVDELYNKDLLAEQSELEKIAKLLDLGHKEGFDSNLNADLDLGLLCYTAFLSSSNAPSDNAIVHIRESLIKLFSQNNDLKGSDIRKFIKSSISSDERWQRMYDSDGKRITGDSVTKIMNSADMDSLVDFKPNEEAIEAETSQELDIDLLNADFEGWSINDLIDIVHGPKDKRTTRDTGAIATLTSVLIGKDKRQRTEYVNGKKAEKDFERKTFDSVSAKFRKLFESYGDFGKNIKKPARTHAYETLRAFISGVLSLIILATKSQSQNKRTGVWEKANNHIQDAYAQIQKADIVKSAIKYGRFESGKDKIPHILKYVENILAITKKAKDDFDPKASMRELGNIHISPDIDKEAKIRAAWSVENISADDVIKRAAQWHVTSIIYGV
ncbi:MAG: sel1 repeat family protein [Fibromonadales bacterium]|nr:sel1 repeat family protein [Fibromonadales bacterium]